VSGGRIGPYTVGRWLARGGSADVYEASHPLIHRALALKIAHRHDSHHGASRFARELQVLSQLEHPAFARAYDLGRTDDGRDWLVLDRVDGLAPRDWANAMGMEGSSRRTRKVMALGAEIASGLAALHTLGLIHGDVKPQNLRVQIGGRPILFDLGAALDLEARVSWSLFGAGLGTSRYAPPEVERRDMLRVGPAADVYALGKTLLELLGTDTHPDLVDLVADDPKLRPDAGAVARRLVAIGEPQPVFAPLSPMLSAYHEAVALGRGFLLDAPPGRGLLVEGARGAGVNAVLARLAGDAVDRGHELVVFSRIGLHGARALIDTPDKTRVLLVDELSALSTETRRELEEVLALATERWSPLLLLAGRETSAVTSGATPLGRRLSLVTARLSVTEADWIHAVGDGLEGRVWHRAFGPRWALATSANAELFAAPPGLEPLSKRLFELTRALAWPTPRAALFAALDTNPASFGHALRELLAHDLIAERDGLVWAVGATRTQRCEVLDRRGQELGRACLDGLARLPWAIASGQRDEAITLLDELAPAGPDALELDHALVLHAVSDHLRGEPSFDALHASWRDALEPSGPADPSSRSIDPIIRLYRHGRLSETRARAEALLRRSNRVADRVAARLVLAQTTQALGLGALARLHRDRAAFEANEPDVLAFELGTDEVPTDELDVALVRGGDEARAAELVAQIGARLDAHDRYTMNLRPELVALRSRTSPGPSRGPDE